MCGIAGFKGVQEQAIQKMVRSLAHRGPDHESILLHSGYSLGMRRLAIIDLETGQQPIWNEDRSICVFMNGEIYNFATLRLSLLEKGHIFSTSSDTEVLVHLYETMGSEMPKALDGMFAFCILDTRKQSLFLARDRFGEKPLYIYSDGKAFAFASEIQSLLQAPNTKRLLNQSHLETLLQYGFAPHSETLFKNVTTLPPGHALQVDDHGIHIIAYDAFNYPVHPVEMNEESLKSKCLELLQQSVKQQMVSDVPLGCFLSGGIDSSTVAALAQSFSASPIDTFNVRFEEAGFDESPIARKVAQHLGTHHHELFLRNQVFEERQFNEMLIHFGQPFVDSSAIPTYSIAQEMHKHLKVVLSGDGGDELFGGYNDFLWGLRLQKLLKVPKPIRRWSLSLINHGPFSHIPPVDFWRGISKALQFSLEPEEHWIPLMHSYFNLQEIERLVPQSKPRYASFFKHADPNNEWTLLRKLMWYRLHCALPGDMLVKVDRMSMCHSVEVRAPFLDRRLFEFTAQLKDHHLVRGQQGKWLLRQVMKKSLPAIVFDHPKTGFNFPLHRYFTEDFKKFANQLLHSKHPLISILDHSVVTNIMRDGFQQQASSFHQSVYKSAHRLWLVIQLFQWYNLFQVDFEENSSTGGL